MGLRAKIRDPERTAIPRPPPCRLPVCGGPSRGKTAIRYAPRRILWTYKIPDCSLISIAQGLHVISPYVRHLRLAAEIRALRAKAGLTAVQLAKRIDRSRADISR